MCDSKEFCKHARARHRTLTELGGEELVEAMELYERGRIMANQVVTLLQSMQPAEPAPVEVKH